MALVTYFTRIAGYFAASKIKMTPKMESALNAVPGSLLVAILGPALIKYGYAEWLAAGVTVYFAHKGRGLLLCISIGLGVVLTARYFINP